MRGRLEKIKRESDVANPGNVRDSYDDPRLVHT
jgi:hypothetical protein